LRANTLLRVCGAIAVATSVSQFAARSSDDEADSIAGEDMRPVPLPTPRNSLTRQESGFGAFGGSGGGSDRAAMRTCALFPLPLPPGLAWLQLPPWVCPPSDEPSPAAPPLERSRSAPLPQFAELSPEVPGWLEVVREPASTTTLNLSPDSGAKGVAMDETLLGASKRACGSLLHLDLTGCVKVTPAAVLAVCQANPRMQHIRAARGGAWGAGAVSQVLAACPELKALEVDVACRRVDDTVASLLTQPTVRLRQLTALSKMSITTMTEQLAPHLPHSSLRRLVLANCLIGPDGAKVLAKALLNDASPKAPLRHLSLYNCAIGPAGARAMGEMLRSNSTLRGLDLGWNAIADEGSIAVTRALQRGNSTLKELSLARNGLRMDAAREIGVMIGTNSSLEVLCLADNDMGPAAGKLIAASLKRNRSLQQFSCPGNALGDAGKDFAAAMRESKSLWKVELHNNALPEAVARELAVLSLQALLRGDPRFDSEEDAAFGEVDVEVDAVHAGDESAHESDSSGSEDGESSDSDAGEPTPGDA
jgi:hypothetical protein